MTATRFAYSRVPKVSLGMATHRVPGVRNSVMLVVSLDTDRGWWRAAPPEASASWQRPRVGWRSPRELVSKVLWCPALTWRASMARAGFSGACQRWGPRCGEKVPRFCPKAGFRKILCSKSDMPAQGAGVGWRSSRQLVSEQFRYSAMAHESVMGIRNEVSIDDTLSKPHSGNM